MKKLFLLSSLLMMFVTFSFFTTNSFAQNEKNIPLQGLAYTESGKTIAYVDFATADALNIESMKISGDFNGWATYKECKLINFGERNFYIAIISNKKLKASIEYCFQVFCKLKDSDGNETGSYTAYFPELAVISNPPIFSGEESFLKWNPPHTGRDFYQAPDPSVIFPDIK